MTTYANQTTVSVEKSRLEVERILKRYGATGFLYGWSNNRHIIGFEMRNRKIKLEVMMPDQNSREITRSHGGRRQRTRSQIEAAYEQATKQRWRAMVLIIKAKLEAIESGISTFEAEFLAGTMLPSGQTVGEWLGPQIDHVYDTGQMPPLLLGSGGER